MSIVHGFNNAEDAESAIALLKRFRKEPRLDTAANETFHEGIDGLLRVKVPSGGIPAATGYEGTPGSADGCEVYIADVDDDTPLQLYDINGDVLTVKVYHFGPTPIPDVDGNGNARMIFAGWAAGRLTALVDYCWS